MKAGWKTSEFWVTIATFASMVASSMGLPIDVGVAEAAVASAYALGRSIYKAAK